MLGGRFELLSDERESFEGRAVGGTGHIVVFTLTVGLVVAKLSPRAAWEDLRSIRDPLLRRC
jgi:hypothetical protein